MKICSKTVANMPVGFYGKFCTEVNGERHTWFIQSLVKATKKLPVVDVELNELDVYLDENAWFHGKNEPTIHAFIEHYRRVDQADLTFPIINNTRFYRVIDGFVAQGGPESTVEAFQPVNGSLAIESEFSLKTKQPLDIFEIEANDGYAKRVGFYKGFTVGQSLDRRENWLLHCYGTLGMGRSNTTDSGGTELYVVIGHAQRYLDKNVTVFGRVVYGMEHLQSLKRSTSLAGPVDLKNHNKISHIQVSSDINSSDLIPLELLKTDSESFEKYIKARKNRQETWFVEGKNYIDVCSIQVPSRLKK